jgi:hypothetical protein
VLITNELVSNAIDHARTQCRVMVRLTPSTVRIFVSDHSTAVPVLQAYGRHALRGRGPHRCRPDSALGLERPSRGQDRMGVDGPRVGLTLRPGSVLMCNIPATIVGPDPPPRRPRIPSHRWLAGQFPEVQVIERSTEREGGDFDDHWLVEGLLRTEVTETGSSVILTLRGNSTSTRQASCATRLWPWSMRTGASSSTPVG